MPAQTFRSGLIKLLNEQARSYDRSQADTPDYVLADFICGCLSAFDNATSLSRPRVPLVMVLPTVNERDRVHP